MTRQITNKLLALLEEGVLSKDTLILAALNYMSEDDVRDMAESNEFLTEDEEDEDDEDQD